MTRSKTLPHQRGGRSTGSRAGKRCPPRSAPPAPTARSLRPIPPRRFGSIAPTRSEKIELVVPIEVKAVADALMARDLVPGPAFFEQCLAAYIAERGDHGIDKDWRTNDAQKLSAVR